LPGESAISEGDERRVVNEEPHINSILIAVMIAFALAGLIVLTVLLI
jgi:hypothetical protein